MRPPGVRRAAVAATAVALAMLTSCSSGPGVEQLAPQASPSTTAAVASPTPSSTPSASSPSASSAAQRVVAADTELRAALVALAAAVERRDESTSFGAARSGIGAGLSQARAALSSVRAGVRYNRSCSTVAARVANVRRGASHARGAHAALLRRTAATRAKMRAVSAARSEVERQMTALMGLVRATSDAPTVTPESVVRTALTGVTSSQAATYAALRDVERKAADAVGNAAVISGRAATVYARVC